MIDNTSTSPKPELSVENHTEVRIAPSYEHAGITIYNGDALEILRQLPDATVNCCITSPPYWGLRDYGVAGQLGLEKTPQEFIANMVEVFREVRRVLRDDGTLWLNLGDCYATGAGKVGDCPGGGDADQRLLHSLYLSFSRQKNPDPPAGHSDAARL